MGKFFVAVLGLLLLSPNLYSQQNKELRLNFLNPGIAWESPLGQHTTLELNAGIGYNYSYPELNTMYGESGFQGIIAPFVDVQGRSYYNLDKREGNSHKGGNFLALRYLYYGPRIAGNVRPNENYTMALGPTWGLKREYGRWALLSSVGPIYYFDLTGSSGFWPVNLEFNFGYRLK
ncbi:hypothetical protein J0A68_00260 [Algoriphagus sp. H41]|uniref:Outer membrane protein beta-barrel domain-containing protein n=1 Tax=Algoriphagus oliviformis TaxID=2811231 RepID=A0ABS3C1C2_9BACT|nr:hypothetical protein [Algoriphagus oliviformis]MBN7809364.1 hypothetical protein [Algoriphagus oliviformis]